MFNELSIVCAGRKDCTVTGTKDVCLVVVTIFVVVTVVGTKDVVVVRIFVVLVVGGSRSCRIAEGDGKAARRIAATIRTLTRCEVFICMLVHAHDTSMFLCKHIVVQESFTIVTQRYNDDGRRRMERTPVWFPCILPYVAITVLRVTKSFDLTVFAV